MIKNASFKLTHNKENFKKIKFFCSKAVMIDILKDDEKYLDQDMEIIIFRQHQLIIY